MKDTSKQYDAVVEKCRSLFANKMKEYGSAWRILRLPSLTDQIFIKAQRIRGLQENEVRKVDEDEIPEFIGIIKSFYYGACAAGKRNCGSTRYATGRFFKAI